MGVLYGRGEWRRTSGRMRRVENDERRTVEKDERGGGGGWGSPGPARSNRRTRPQPAGTASGPEPIDPGGAGASKG